MLEMVTGRDAVVLMSPVAVVVVVVVGPRRRGCHGVMMRGMVFWLMMVMELMLLMDGGIQVG